MNIIESVSGSYLIKAEAWEVRMLIEALENDYDHRHVTCNWARGMREVVRKKNYQTDNGCPPYKLANYGGGQ